MTKMINDWQAVKLSDVTEYVNRGIPPNYTENNSGTAVVNQKCIRNGQVNLDLCRLTDESIRPVTTEKVIQPWDILVNSTGTGTVGRVGQIVNLAKRTTADSHVTIVRPNKDIIDPIYLGHWLITKEVELENLAGGSTNQVELSRARISDVDVILPPIKIQKKISYFLDTLNSSIHKTDQIIQKTEELKKGLMFELFVTGLGCSSFKTTVHGKIPNHWELKKVIEVASVVDSLHQTPKYSDSGFPMVRVMDIKSGDLNLTNCIKVSEEVYRQFTKNHTPIKGDLVISRVGSFGIFSYVNTSDNFCLGQNTAVISPKIDSLFLYYVLQSPIPTNQVNKLVVGSNQKTLSLGYIRNLFIPIPPDNEQKEIAQILTSVDQKLANEKSYRDRLVVMKKGLMNDIFTRKVEIN